MAFTSTITEESVFGNKRITWGTWDNGGGVTSGNIDTGLQICEFITLQPKGTGAIRVETGVDETLPCDGSAVTINLGASQDVDGYWWAFGY